MSQERITTLLSENRSYLPPEHGKTSAWVCGPEEYNALCSRALEDPNDFWGARASQLIHWFKRWDKVLDADDVNHKYKWFTGGVLNASFNCIDRHLISGRRNKAALIWQGEKETDVRCYTYQMLYTEVCRVAHALSSLRIRKGDHVALYMPMIPELFIAMLACARIGAIHTAIFSGYAEGGVRSRIQGCKARVVITADAAVRGGKFKPLKANLDPILEKCPSVAHVVVVKHAGIDGVTMQRNRDVWWHDLIDDFTLNPDFPCEPMDANDTLFLLHTSGSTGKPTGVMHSTGGYLTYAAHSTQWCFDMRDDDVYWCTADAGWITGHTYGVYGPLSLGATTLMFEGVPTWPYPDRYWRIVENFRVNIFYTAPTVIRSLMRMNEAWTERYDLRSLLQLPIVVDGKPVACLLLGSRLTSRIAPATLHSLAVLGRYFGQTLQRLDSLEESSRLQHNLSGIFDTLTDFIFVLDMECTILHYNRAVAETLGYGRDSLKGKPILAVHPQNLRDIAEQRATALVVVPSLLVGPCLPTAELLALSSLLTPISE